MTSAWAPLAMVLVATTGAWVLGPLTAAAYLLPCAEGGALTPVGRTLLGRAQVGAWVWCAAATVAIPPALADAVGVPLADVARWDLVTAFVWDVPMTRSLLVAAIIAGIVTFLCFAAKRIGGIALIGVLAAIGVAAPGVAVGHGGISDHGLHVLSGAVALLATSLWAGSLVALLGIGRLAASDDSARAEAVRRHGRAVPAYSTAALIGVSGLGLARIDGDVTAWWTGFGVLAVVLAVVSLGSLGSWRQSSGWRGTGLIPLASSALLLIGSALLITLQPPGSGGEGPLTLAEQLIGEAMPLPFTFVRAIAPHLDTAAIVTTSVIAGLYLTGVSRLHRRGDQWPIGRTVAMLLGLLSILAVTVTQLGAYSTVLFSAHMIQHMVLSMVTPVFLVLSGPITLALRALHPATRGQRGPREWVVAFQHCAPVRILTTPLVAFVVYITSLYGLYFTPLFSTLMGSHLGHLAMLTHFVLAGYFFYWMIIGVDPTPKPVPYWARLLLLLAGMAVHAVFGVIVMISPTSIAGDWYAQVAPPWLSDPISDQYLAGGIAWSFGELPTLLIIGALVFQWSRAEERDNRRLDRKADRDGDSDLAAYNDYLATLSRRR